MIRAHDLRGIGGSALFRAQIPGSRRVFPNALMILMKVREGFCHGHAK
jgi:hypothetical protein